MPRGSTNVDPADPDLAVAAEAALKALSSFQRETIQLFIQAAQLLALPRSFGEIFGLVFSTEAPLCLDDVADRLQLSRGSASQGLRWLRAVGAISRVYIPGDRREHFTAETSLRQLIRGFLREKIKPHLVSGAERLDSLKSAAAILAPADQPFARSRHAQLRRWHTVIKRALPVLLSIAGKDRPSEFKADLPLKQAINAPS